MFDTVLVAGRGLLTGRVVRTCQRLGARTATVHSAADVEAPHAVEADESLLLGGPDPATSYLDGRKVIEAAGQAAAQALHPGSGPLAGSAAFARSVTAAGLVWLGPPPAVLDALAAQPAEHAGGGRRLVVQLLGLDGGRVRAVTDLEQRADVVECPAPDLTATARQALHAVAVQAGQAIGLRGPGAIEVVLDGGQPVVAGAWAGVRVDQAAVELVTGIDLVEQQLLLAAGSAAGADGGSDGVALQVELRAAAPGVLTAWQPPSRRRQVRVESGYAAGAQTSSYDDLLGALAVWGPDRDAAAQRLEATRAEWLLDGVPLLGRV